MISTYPKISIVAAGAVLLTGLVGEHAKAYEFFTDRDEWLEAVQGKQINLEDFNNIPDGQYATGELPTDVFINLEPFPTNPLNVRISDGSVVRVPNRDFTVQMAFDREVWGVGLDVISEESYQYALVGFDSAGEELFEFSGDNGDFDFVGWVAEEGDFSALRTDVFFDFGTELSWDNLMVDQERDSTSVPEGGSGVATGVGIIASLGFLRKKKV